MANDWTVNVIRDTEFLAILQRLVRGHASIVVILPPSDNVDATGTVTEPHALEVNMLAGASSQHASGLLVDLREHRVTWGSSDIPLSAREFDLISCLARDRGAAVSFEALLECASTLGDLDTLKTAMKRLRRKLHQAGAEGILQSIHGFGYRLTS